MAATSSPHDDPTQDRHTQDRHTQDRRQFEVDPDYAGERLDRWLAHQNDDMSRSRIQQLIEQGHVTLNGERVPSSTSLKAGQIAVLNVPAPVAVTLAAQDIPLDIVFEDKHLIVINKPAGLVVHPAAGNPDMTLVNALLAHCGTSLLGIGGELRPGIVHRLDKDTSGLLVAAKSGEAHAKLAEQFAAHSIDRAYDALVWGVPRPASGIIRGQIGRSVSNRQKMAVKTSGGKYAETHYSAQESYGGAASWVECVLMTGRTHQIRVHMSSLGHAVIGDTAYSTVRSKFIKELDDDTATLVREFPRQALHARLLGFEHPITGKTLRFEKAPPEDIQALATALRQATQKGGVKKITVQETAVNEAPAKETSAKKTTQKKPAAKKTPVKKTPVKKTTGKKKIVKKKVVTKPALKKKSVKKKIAKKATTKKPVAKKKASKKKTAQKPALKKNATKKKR